MAIAMPGGYYLLDGLGIELTGSPTVYAGAWQAAVAALGSGKPIVAYNTTYGTAPVSPVPVFGWYLSTTRICLVGATLHILIDSDNTVTVQDVAPST